MSKEVKLVVCNEPQNCGTVKALESEVQRLTEQLENCHTLSGASIREGLKMAERAESAEVDAEKWGELTRLWGLDDKEKIRHDFLIATDKDMAIINLYRRLEKKGDVESRLAKAWDFLEDLKHRPYVPPWLIKGLSDALGGSGGEEQK